MLDDQLPVGDGLSGTGFEEGALQGDQGHCIEAESIAVLDECWSWLAVVVQGGEEREAPGRLGRRLVEAVTGRFDDPDALDQPLCVDVELQQDGPLAPFQQRSFRVGRG